MGIYKGFNRIFCQVQRNRIDATGHNEAVVTLHTHPYFGRMNKAVILSMKKSIAEGANNDRCKVDYMTDDDERLILSHPEHQANCAKGVQYRFVLYCVFVFFVRGNRELYNLLLKDIEVGFDER
jgi:hypothetical protein